MSVEHQGYPVKVFLVTSMLKKSSTRRHREMLRCTASVSCPARSCAGRGFAGRQSYSAWNVDCVFIPR